MIDFNKIKPLGSRVLVKSDPKEDKVNGILIPEANKTKNLVGTVIAIGPGTVDEPMTVKVGEKVLYGEYAGTKVANDLLLMNEKDMLAVI